MFQSRFNLDGSVTNHCCRCNIILGNYSRIKRGYHYCDLCFNNNWFIGDFVIIINDKHFEGRVFILEKFYDKDFVSLLDPNMKMFSATMNLKSLKKMENDQGKQKSEKTG